MKIKIGSKLRRLLKLPKKSKTNVVHFIGSITDCNYQVRYLLDRNDNELISVSLTRASDTESSGWKDRYAILICYKTIIY